MNERCAAKRNRYHINATDYRTEVLTALHLKILQVELDQNADATRINDRITSAEKEIVGSKTAGLAGLMSPTPILLRFPPYSWCIRILRFDPMRRAAGTVTRVLALRHNALKPHLAGMKEDSGSVLGEVLIET